jgi:DHA2 family multidrug resistance protein
MLNGYTALFASKGFDASVAAKKALALVYQTVQAQAGTLSFENSFWVMSIIVLVLVPLPFIMRRPKPGEQQPSAAH